MHAIIVYKNVYSIQTLRTYKDNCIDSSNSKKNVQHLHIDFVKNISV